MSSAAAILYEDIFEITDINPEGKCATEFKSISRVVGRGVTYECELVCDFNTEMIKFRCLGIDILGGNKFRDILRVFMRA